MMAKIVKGQGFKGVVNYILDQAKGTEILDSAGVRLKNPDTIVQSFIAQTELNSRIKKPVEHISLDFSAQDRDKLSNELLVQIALDYMKHMGISDTQYLIGRHYDKEHPHIHLVFNRVDNDGKTISDRNDRFRSEKICKELTNKYNLYYAHGKENVKEHRLREPDKTKYEIYNSLKEIVPKCQNWDQIIKGLKSQKIGVTFKYKGRSDEIQGVIFDKNSYTFNGSKVDRQFSYSKISQQLQLNEQESAQVDHQYSRDAGFHSEIPSLGYAINDLLFQLQRQAKYSDSKDEMEAIRKFKKKKKKGLRR